ncbi:MAG: leucyl aminopeptidase [Cellvibrionales bacterium]|nr:leucyl aminopeptidase [Cellvibrionales bacterium]
MDFSLKTAASGVKTKANVFVLPAHESTTLPSIVDEIDKSLNGQITIRQKSKRLRLKNGQVNGFTVVEKASWSDVILAGSKKGASQRDWIAFTTAVFNALKLAKAGSVVIDLTQVDAALSEALLIQLLAKTFVEVSYQYDTTLSDKKDKLLLKKVHLIVSSANAANKHAAELGRSMGLGANVAKQLGNLPGNVCTPSFLAKEAQGLAKSYQKVSTEILTEAQLKKLKMGSLLSVTAGTDEPAKVIVMKYQGDKASQKPVVLVGKGVTFDSGGISLKPGARMDEMKFDMCGAASVFGTMKAVAELGLKVNLIGVVGAVENMPSGCATKPGDVVTSMSGKTIEVLNTDAEGRLVLCDLLTYVEKFKPKAVVDIATLTGACVVALGHHASAVYSNDDDFQMALKKAGDVVYDRAWPMPLWDEYDEQLKSAFADMGNIGGPDGGSVTAACFLSRFAKNYTWAHMDIAGSAWQKKKASGRPVGLLTQYIIDQI